jgi:hypothetical protein
MSRFDALAERLLCEGVAYRHVRRLIGEFKDHHEDARRAELSAGVGEADAEAAAWARLGDPDQLAASVLARPELRALSARYPRLWGGAAPVAFWLGLVIAATVFMLGIIYALREVRLIPPGGSPLLAPLQAPADVFFFLLIRVAPVVIGAALLAGALRQRSELMWPMIGLVIMAVAGGGADAGATFSLVQDVPSSLRLGVGFSREYGAQIAVMFSLMLTPFLVRRRLTRPPA